MENEKRLIDANALKSEFEWLKSVVNESSKDEVMDVMQRIDNAPTVDAVEVVRCKDCRLYEMGVEYYGGGTKDICRLFKRQEREDSFCAHGERRADNATD